MARKSIFTLVLLAAAVEWPGAVAVEIKGRLVDGTAMLRLNGMSGLGEAGFKEEAQRVPIPNVRLQLFRIDGPARAAVWEGPTDGEGRFAASWPGNVNPGMGDLPDQPVFVAVAPTSGSRPAAQYSVPLALAAGHENEVRVYNLTQDASTIRNAGIEILFNLAEGPGGDGSRGGENLLNVQMTFTAGNFGGDLYIGEAGHTRTGSRTVFRVPLPPEARNIHAPGWTITPDGWAVVDSPLAPISEAGKDEQFFHLHFQTPAYQEAAFWIPADLPLERAVVWAVHPDMDLVSPQLRGKETLNKQPPPNDPGGAPRDWTVLFGRGLKAGDPLSVGLTVNSSTLRQVNYRTLKVVAGFVLGALLALLAGLVLGKRGPRVEALLSEASGEEIIERIAQLDAQFEKRLISKEEHRSTRDRLLKLARYEVPELAEAEVKGGRGLPPEVVRLVQRLGEVEEEGLSDPRKIQERLLLLEEIAKVVSRSVGVGKEAGAGKGAGVGKEAGGGKEEKGGSRRGSPVEEGRA